MGVPAGWTPSTTRSGDWVITQPGVYQDVKVNGTIYVRANGVTLRRVHVAGGNIWTETDGRCFQTTLEQVTLSPPDGATYMPPNPRAGNRTADIDGSIGPASITARGVALINRTEGIRAGYSSVASCTALDFRDTYIGIRPDPNWCQPRGPYDWHGDGLQGYGGPAVRLTRVTIRYEGGGCYTTAPIFYPRASANGNNSGNTRMDVDGLYIHASGFGGYAFTLGMPATVRDLRIATGSWGYGPLNVYCSAVASWQASIVSPGADGQPGATVRTQACNTSDGR